MRKFLLLLPLFLLGCDSTPTTETSPTVATPEVAEPAKGEEKGDEEDGKVLTEVGQVLENEGGRFELVKITEPNETVESGPIKMTIESVKVSKVNPKGPVKIAFEDKEEGTLALVNVIVENTSEDTISFHPNQGIITTNTGEQQNAQLLLSDKVGGEFIGKVTKKGKVYFILDSKPEDINKIKFVVNAANNEKFQPLGERITLEYEFD